MNTLAGVDAATKHPWLIGAGVAADVVGAGVSAYQAEKERKRREALEREQFDWQKKTDQEKQLNTERQIGQNTIASMKSSFKDNLYRAYTRG